MRNIKITIEADGSATVEVNGVPGPECEKLTNELIEALGVKESNERTKEFYATATTKPVVSAGH